MRIAVTDYDGTLNHRGKIEARSMDAIQRWRNAGNRFGIATGRDLSMILHEIEKWRIPFDFLICCNGAVIYGPDLAVWRSVDIEDARIPQVLSHPAAIASMHLEMCCDGKVYLCAQDEKTWFPALGSPYTEIFREDALAATGVQQVSFAYFSASDGTRYAAELNAAFGESMFAHQNGACIDLTHKTVSKAEGIDALLRITGWSASGLLAIGDSDNDLPMIRKYAGFAVSRAADTAKAAARALYESVGQMLDEVLSE